MRNLHNQVRMSPNPAATDQMEWLGFVSFANQRQLQRAWLNVTRCSIPKACTSVAYNLPCVCEFSGHLSQLPHNYPGFLVSLDKLQRISGGEPKKSAEAIHGQHGRPVSS